MDIGVVSWASFAVSSSSLSSGMTQPVCCASWQTTPLASTTLAQHCSRPPGSVPQPAPPHVPPHEAGQHTLPAAETEPSLQNSFALGSGLPW